MSKIDALFELINKENVYPVDLDEQSKALVVESYVLFGEIGAVDSKFDKLYKEYLIDRHSENVLFKNAKKEFDPLNIVTDLLIIVSDDLMSNYNDYLNGQYSIDNELVLRGGAQFRNSLNELYTEDRYILSYSHPYIVGGENLNAKTVAKILVNTKLDMVERNEVFINALNNLQEELKEKTYSNCIVVIKDRLNLNKNCEKTLKKMLKIAKIKNYLIKI